MVRVAYEPSNYPGKCVSGWGENLVATITLSSLWDSPLQLSINNMLPWWHWSHICAWRHPLLNYPMATPFFTRQSSSFPNSAVETCHDVTILSSRMNISYCSFCLVYVVTLLITWPNKINFHNDIIWQAMHLANKGVSPYLESEGPTGELKRGCVHI